MILLIILTCTTCITAGLGCVTAILGFLNRKKIAEVHVLVNSQLDQVMSRLQLSEGRLQDLKDSKTK